ncbi:OmpA family protein [Arcobacter peruensis]|uniref:OmpA family protein n=1 Tax=Arcobacter peruensis TaxID=2320140 RepID=UPI000F077473|nr:OmpA family protein [Arcobacter peruensis]
MKKIILSTVACATMMLAANEYKYEITPMIGGAYTEGNLGMQQNYVNGGLALGFNQTDSMIDQVEIAAFRTVEDAKYYNLGGRDTGITRVFVNLVKDYPLSSNFSLYALAGAGVEFFDDEANDNNENGIVGNYGFGWKYKIAEQFALKADVRHLIEADHGDNTLLYNLGFSIPFGQVAKAAPVVAAPVVVAPMDSDNDGVIDAKDKCPNTVAGATVNAMGCEMDDDKDGVVNRLDQCPNTISGAKVDTVGCMTLVNLNINFDTNSAVVKDQYNQRIANFANAMKNNTKLKATIEAHTDSVGSAKYNQKLSEKRAASTVEVLKSLNIDASRLTAVGYGETKPAVSNMTKEGRAQNRRVHAVITK